MLLEHWLSIGLDVAQKMVLPGLLLAIATSGLIVVAGWHRRREILARGGPIGENSGFAFTPRMELAQTTFAAGMLDVAAEAGALMRQFESLAARQFVQLDIAVQASLTVRADPRVFREIVSDLLIHAIGQSKCGRVLLTAGRHGGRVQVCVTDDGDAAPRHIQEAALRPASSLAALQGASLDIDPRSGFGTTIVLRLPIPVARSQQATAAGAATDRTVSIAPTALDPKLIWAPRNADARHSDVHSSANSSTR